MMESIWRALVTLFQSDFTKCDDEAIKIFGTWSENRIECVALLSLWQHAMGLSWWNFSYLRCLDSKDRLQFLVRAVQLLVLKIADPQERRHMILSGALDFELWVEVMNSIPLVKNYQVWRYATDWEAYGDQRNRDNVSSLHVEVIFFENAARNTLQSTIDILRRPGHKTELTKWFTRMSLTSRVCSCEHDLTREHTCTTCGSEPPHCVITGYTSVPIAQAVPVSVLNEPARNLDCSIFSINV